LVDDPSVIMLLPTMQAQGNFPLKRRKISLHNGGKS
jgi:hypothetical protein